MDISTVFQHAKPISFANQEASLSVPEAQDPTRNLMFDLLQLISEVVEGLTPKDQLQAHIRIVEQRITKGA